MKNSLSMACALGFTLIAASVFAEEADLESFVRQLHPEGVPYETAARFDRKTTVPTLLKILGDPTEAEHWPNVVITLGMIGDARAVEPLIQFLENDPGERLSRPHYLAKTGVVMALGYLLNKTKDDRALSYLIDSARPLVWAKRDLTWISPDHARAEGRDQQLSKMAILGLALSAQPGARDALVDLQRPGEVGPDAKFLSRVSEVISGALTEQDVIFTKGLDRYDSDRRARTSR